MKAHFEMMASYNAWANVRVYDAVAELQDEDYRRDMGTFFGSLHATLNHIFVADIIWMSRFRGLSNPPWTLDHIAHNFLSELRARRVSLDRDILGFVFCRDTEELTGEFTYRPVTSPEPVTQTLSSALAHFFNHQTHHRGQCHAMLTRLGVDAPELDLIYYQRQG